jgi:hypothetical protein
MRLRTAVAAILLLGLLAGCGQSEQISTTASKETGCHAGGSILPLVPEAPDWWKEGPGPTLALACLDDRVAGEAAIVGYSSPGSSGGRCVTAYSVSLHQSHGEQCAAPGAPGNWSCDGAQGCVIGFFHEGGLTELDGELSARVKGIRVLAKGQPLREGIAVAHVRGKTVRLIGAEEPFGFFLVFIDGCLHPKQVKIELLGADGSPFGKARGWSGPVINCNYRLHRAAHLQAS